MTDDFKTLQGIRIRTADPAFLPGDINLVFDCIDAFQIGQEKADQIEKNLLSWW